MSEWNEYKLGDIGTFFGGVTSIKREDYGFGTPFINYKNVYKNTKIDVSQLELMNVKKNDLEKRNCIYGDIFFTASSETPDEVAMSSVLLDNIENLTFNGFCKRFRLNDFTILNPNYARYLFRDNKFRISVYEVANGDIRYNISQESLSNIVVKLPNLSKQNAIAQILSSLDDKIELNYKINQELEKLAQTLFKQWFIDFEFPNENGDPYKSSGGVMEESLLGDIPKDWKISAIKDWGEIVCGKTPSKANKDFFGKDILFIKIPDMHNNVFINKTVDGLSILGAENQKNKRLKKGAVIVSSIATVGLVSIVSKDSQTNQQINAIVPKKKIYTNFLFLLLKTKTDDFKQLASGGSATLNMNTSTFKEYKILMPNQNILDLFDSLVGYLFEKIQCLSTEIEELKKTRDTLLPKLISGELEINEINY